MVESKYTIVKRNKLKKKRKEKLTKICNDCPGLCMFQARHNGDQIEVHICHNHGNALLGVAAHAMTLHNK